MQNSGSYSNTFTNVRDDFYACLLVRNHNIIKFREPILGLATYNMWYPLCGGLTLIFSN